MSHESGGGRPYHCVDGEVFPEPYDPERPHLRGGDSAYRSSIPKNIAWVDTQTSHECDPSPATNPGSDLYEVPAKDYYTARRHQGRRPDAQTQARAAFDFNDNRQPNPWHSTGVEEQRARERVREAEPTTDHDIRRFAACQDKDLDEYLASRAISRGFLTEIDQFFQGHLEIATFPEGRSMLRQIATLPPLEAYKTFLKGYTLPARYLNGIIRSDYFRLPLDFHYQPLSAKRDPELHDFFAGFDYRHDIIDRIDHEVRHSMKDLAYGRAVTLALRKLICYALWGNPVDAYKWFEYSYQKEFMPHRYLPEHVILGHLPKPSNLQEPRPSTFLNGHKKHGDVRARMAHANDQGVGRWSFAHAFQNLPSSVLNSSRCFGRPHC
ncbi:hypothetical protein EK21DRAFT_65908 [Setomelanomma holmii]|uniref:Uncharacterized protein n=1 Tax=Setomelanomma holmii TaxID=210430 RepID=A0A9P4LNT8_9PLEO|nr:hypothetical protein EK21DRAFT_65908 [Setomelanomma holmii]